MHGRHLDGSHSSFLLRFLSALIFFVTSLHRMRRWRSPYDYVNRDDGRHPQQGLVYPDDLQGCVGAWEMPSRGLVMR